MNTFRDWRGQEISEADVLQMAPEGWHPILKEAFEKLFALGWDGSIDQIKEKFGTLRLYIGNETYEMPPVIMEAEEKSCRTCQDCGAQGAKIHPGWSWFLTQCHDCNKKREEEEKRRTIGGESIDY